MVSKFRNEVLGVIESWRNKTSSQPIRMPRPCEQSSQKAQNLARHFLQQKPINTQGLLSLRCLLSSNRRLSNRVTTTAWFSSNVWRHRGQVVPHERTHKSMHGLWKICLHGRRRNLELRFMSSKQISQVLGGQKHYIENLASLGLYREQNVPCSGSSEPL